MCNVYTTHDGNIGRRHRLWHIISTAAADPQCLRLPRNRQRVDTVDDRFALGNGPAGSVWPSDPKAPAAPSSNCERQVVIWFG